MGHNLQHTIFFVAGITLVIVFPIIAELHYGRPLSWWLIRVFVGWCATVIVMWFLSKY
jgi:hypothetical protein